jgi:hypothetical protein
MGTCRRRVNISKLKLADQTLDYKYQILIGLSINSLVYQVSKGSGKSVFTNCKEVGISKMIAFD